MRAAPFIIVAAVAIGSLAYNRSSYSHWVDKDRDCLNERHELLEQSSIADLEYSSDGCAVISGFWIDPYTGNSYTDPQLLDVDHVVPLKYAHRHGAKYWRRKKKTEFANDSENLLVVSRSENRRKGAKGPAEYLPPRREYECDYAHKWAHVITKYDLSVASKDQAKIDHVLGGCY